MNEALFSRRDALRRGGFTLIEVVIALAIFLFGALAIIRIFPPALGVIQNSGDRLTALNLNRSTLARYAKESSSLPYAIYNNNFNSITAPFQPVAFAGSTVGSAIRNNSIPRSNVQNIAGSSLDQFKLISGEKQKVRSIGPSASPTFYVVTSFPIAGPIVPGPPPTRPPLAMVYREVTMSGVTTQTKTVGTNRSGFLDFSNASTVPPAAATDLIYYVSYKYFEGGILNATNDEAVNSTAGTSVVSAIPPILTANNSDVQVLQGRRLTTPTIVGAPPNGVVDGPIQVRYRQLLTGAISVDPNIERQNTRNNLGILILTGVTEGQEVSVDYQINSWSQLVSNSLPSVKPEDPPAHAAVPPPPNPPNPGTPMEVVLPIRFLADDRDGSVTSIYSLLSFLNSANTSTLEANAINASDVLATPGQFTLRGVNRKAGRIIFDINDYAPVNPRDYTVFQSRVVYQTIDNWTHQLSVAPANYTPFYDLTTNGVAAVNTTAPQPWRHYFWNRNIESRRIFFPPSEAGKTISLSFSYDPDPSATSAPPVTETGSVVTIDERWIRASEAPPNAALMAATDSDGVQWLAYAEPKKDPISGATLELVSIQSIKGISVQSRTAWLDGDKFNQVSTVGFRGAGN